MVLYVLMLYWFCVVFRVVLWVWFSIALLLLIVLVWYFICKQLFSVGALLFSVSWIVVVCLGLVFVFCFVWCSFVAWLVWGGFGYDAVDFCVLG